MRVACGSTDNRVPWQLDRLVKWSTTDDGATDGRSKTQRFEIRNTCHLSHMPSCNIPYEKYVRKILLPSSGSELGSHCISTLYVVHFMRSTILKLSELFIIYWCERAIDPTLQYGEKRRQKRQRFRTCNSHKSRRFVIGISFVRNCWFDHAL